MTIQNKIQTKFSYTAITVLIDASLVLAVVYITIILFPDLKGKAYIENNFLTNYLGICLFLFLREVFSYKVYIILTSNDLYLKIGSSNEYTKIEKIQEDKAWLFKYKIYKLTLYNHATIIHKYMFEKNDFEKIENFINGINNKPSTKDLKTSTKLHLRKSTH